MAKDGYAGFRQSFDERSNRIESDWFGTNGNPILNNEGIAKVIYNYDTHGNETQRAFFGVDGKPTLSTQGSAGYHQAFDERGNRIELDYFGADGSAARIAPALIEINLAGSHFGLTTATPSEI